MYLRQNRFSRRLSYPPVNAPHNPPAFSRLHPDRLAAKSAVPFPFWPSLPLRALFEFPPPIRCPPRESFRNWIPASGSPHLRAPETGSPCFPFPLRSGGAGSPAKLRAHARVDRGLYFRVPQRDHPSPWPGKLS